MSDAPVVVTSWPAPRCVHVWLDGTAVDKCRACGLERPRRPVFGAADPTLYLEPLCAWCAHPFSKHEELNHGLDAACTECYCEAWA